MTDDIRLTNQDMVMDALTCRLGILTDTRQVVMFLCSSALHLTHVFVSGNLTLILTIRYSALLHSKMWRFFSVIAYGVCLEIMRCNGSVRSQHIFLPQILYALTGREDHLGL